MALSFLSVHLFYVDAGASVFVRPSATIARRRHVRKANPPPGRRQRAPGGMASPAQAYVRRRYVA